MRAAAMALMAWKRWSDPQAPAWNVIFNVAPATGSLEPGLPSLFPEPVLPAAVGFELPAGDLLEGPDHLGADLRPDVVARLPVVRPRVGVGVGVLGGGLLHLLDEEGDGLLVLDEPEEAHAPLRHEPGVAGVDLLRPADVVQQLADRLRRLRLAEPAEGLRGRGLGLGVPGEALL